MKIKLTEGQIRRLHNITEGKENKYNSLVKLDFSFLGDSKVTGYDISDIASIEVRVGYDIEIEARSWGLKSVDLFGITGPSDIDMEVEIGINGDGDYETKIFPLKLDWENAKIEKQSGKGVVTIDNVIDVWLGWEEQSGFFVKEMTITVYSL